MLKTCLMTYVCVDYLMISCKYMYGCKNNIEKKLKIYFFYVCVGGGGGLGARAVLIFNLIKGQFGKGYWRHTQERWEG